MNHSSARKKFAILLFLAFPLNFIASNQAIATSLYYEETDGYIYTVVPSASMQPALKVGDVILVEKDIPASEIIAAPKDAYPPGDIILFRRPGKSDQLIVHRAVEKFLDGGIWYFKTRGDYNLFNDPWSIPETDVVGKVVSINPEDGPIPMKIGVIHDPNLVNSTWPFQIEAVEQASSILTITYISAANTIILRNLTDLADISSPPSDKKVIGNYIEIFSVWEHSVPPTSWSFDATLRIYYSTEQLTSLSLDENTLTIHFWNDTIHEWDSVESHVNKEQHYVEASIDHWSIWALMGNPIKPFWSQTWFWVLAAVVGGVGLVFAVAMTVRRKYSIRIERKGTLPDTVRLKLS